MLIPYNQLSEEQKGVIRRISRESGNLFVEGPPGSGKTLISLYTLVDIIRESNVKPFLIIYNQSLYGYLSSALKELGIQDNLTIVTKDKFFWDKARNEYGIPSPDSKLAYMEKYNYLLDNLLVQKIRKEYDVTIIDEVQDINKKEWELIQKLSKRVLALGDFNQGVYKTDLTKSIVSSSGIFEKLTKIFRFHKNIAKIAQIFSRNNEDLENKVSIDSSTVPKLIDVKEESVSMSVYPNPSTGVFDLIISESTAVINSILVFNLEGRLLYESQSATSSVTIDLSDLDHGIYLLKIKTLIDETEVRLTERIIVSK